MLSIRLVLSSFRAFIGLKVNIGKSEIVPIGEVNNIDALANILQYRVGRLPMKYLGMPLRTSFKSAAIWNPILEKMENKLSGWKCLYLSEGGRLMLIKSTLSSLPMYFLLFLKLLQLYWKVFRGIFCGGLLRGVSSIHWWLGIRCVLPLRGAVWG